MAYQQVGAGRQRACVVGGVLAVQGLLAWAVVSGLAVRYVPRMPDVFTASNQPKEWPLPTMPPRPPVHSQTHHRAITPSHIADLPPRPADPVPIDPFPTGPTSTDPSPGASVAPTPQPSPKPAFAPLGARAIGDPVRWLSDNDYPASELRAGHEGAARFRLEIGADGRVSGCTIIASTGFAGLDAATCSIVSRRARFAPARDGSGAAVSGSYSGGVRWLIPRD